MLGGNSSRLRRGAVYALNRPISVTEIKAVFCVFPKNRFAVPETIGADFFILRRDSRKHLNERSDLCVHGSFQFS